MLFNFLKYLQPTSYFTLKNKKGEYIYPDLSEEDLKDLPISTDNFFLDENARKLELSYRLISAGYIGNFKRIKEFQKITVKDEYRFIKKYFSSFWVFYVFIIRILSLKNPVKEIQGFLLTRRVKREKYYETPIIYSRWKHFDSKLIKNNPKVSVIIPTLNRYEYLKDVLEDLEKQDYNNFDVIVIDQSEPFKKEFYDGYNLNLKVEHQEEKALWLARNRAIKMSDATYLLLYDDDSRVDSNWISEHLKCIDFFNADISSGVSISLIGAKIPKDYSFFKYSEQLDTGNVLIKRNVFKKIGLFDRQYEKQRMGDGEYGLRAYLEGFVNISNPYAKRLHLKVGTGGLRQMGSWDGFRPKKWLDPRPIPSVLYQFRKYYGNKRAFYSILKTVPQSIVPYSYKGNKKIVILAYLSLIVVWPLITYQVMKSWRLASKKLKEGALIEKLQD